MIEKKEFENIILGKLDIPIVGNTIITMNIYVMIYKLRSVTVDE